MRDGRNKTEETHTKPRRNDGLTVRCAFVRASSPRVEQSEQGHTYETRIADRINSGRHQHIRVRRRQGKNRFHLRQAQPRADGA